MSNDFIYVYEKNERSAEKPSIFNLEIPEKYQEEFQESISEKRGTFFQIIKSFKAEKSGFITYNLQTTDYIGIFSFPDNPPVIIQPKIPNADFLQMLNYVNLEQFHIFESLVQRISPHETFFKAIVKMFLDELNKFFKNPLQKLYRENIETLKGIKGKLLVSDSLKQLKIFHGEFVCEFVVFTKNTIHNQIIKYALYLLQFITYSNLLVKINYFLKRFNYITLVKIQDYHFNSLTYNRFTAHYKVIHDFCKMVIKRFAFGKKIGQYSCHSLLFYSSSIYEIFLRELLKELLGPKNLIVEKYSGRKIQPDIIIKRNFQIHLICDAKYKFDYDRTIDYRELLDYMTELKKKEDIEFPKKYRNGILIYPFTNNNESFLKAHYSFIKETLKDKNNNRKFNFTMYKETFNLYKAKLPINVSDKSLFKFLKEDFKIVVCNLFLVEKYKNESYYAYLIDLSQIDNRTYLDQWVNVLVERFLSR